MQQYHLSFGVINVLRDDIAEVIVDEGIEMDMKLVDEYHDFLLHQLKAPFSLLINKVNSYTYSFEAQLHLANLAEVRSMAVAAYQTSARISTEHMRDNIPRQFPWHLRTFDNRDEALTWLLQDADHPAAISA